MYVIW